VCFCVLFLLCGAVTKPSTSPVVGKHSITELPPQPSNPGVLLFYIDIEYLVHNVSCSQICGTCPLTALDGVRIELSGDPSQDMPRR
jgi:hypothetical protein